MVTESIQTFNGIPLFFIAYEPDLGKRTANILLVHGVGEHCERYTHVADFFNKHGIAIYTFDQFGHGKSGAKRGSSSFPRTFQVVNEYKKQIKEEYPDIPLFLYGHSMGGEIALAYTYEYPDNLTGVIATSAALDIKKPLPSFLMPLLFGMAKIFPNFTISNGLSIDGITHDPVMVKKYKEDPLNHDQVSLELGCDMLRYSDKLLQQEKPFPVPLFFMQGMADKLVPPAGAEQFTTAQAKKNADVTYYPVPDGYHEIHNDHDQLAHLEKIFQWIKTQIEHN